MALKRRTDPCARPWGTVDARSVYVAISRARLGAAIHTDSRANLTDALGIRGGTQVGAIDETFTRKVAAPATPATVRAVEMAIKNYGDQEIR